MRVKFAARILHDSGRLQQLPVLVDMFPQPAGHAGEAAPRHLSKYVELLLHVVQHLGAVRIAQRVGREIAEGAAGPVAVLQTALAVIGDLHAQIFLI